MKEINLPTGNYILILVTDDAYDFSNNLHSSQIDYLINVPFKDSFLKVSDAVIIREHYNDKFKIISTTNNITEEQCKSIVQQQWGTNYKDYTKVGYQNNPFMFKTAKESLQSLIQSVGLDLKLNYLILKKI